MVFLFINLISLISCIYSVEKKSSHYFNDWIIAASVTPDDVEENICILFAHNNLCIYNTLTKNMENIWCEEKCILYPLKILIKEVKYLLFS